MVFRTPPCKDCSDRHIMCHSICSKHKAWKAEENRKNAAVNKQKDIVNGFVEYETKSYIKHVVRRRAQGVR